jgi:hypothetical protein
MLFGHPPPNRVTGVAAASGGRRAPIGIRRAGRISSCESGLPEDVFFGFSLLIGTGTGCGSAEVALSLLALTASCAAPWALESTLEWFKPRKCSVCFGAGYTPCTGCGGRGRRGGIFDVPLEVRR